MAITLRTNKGTALSYQELDINFQSFFYSASIPADSSSLQLHYTGSGLQGAGVVNIPLNTFTGSVQVAGSVNELQYKSSVSAFGGTTNIVYDSAKGGIGIGTTSLSTNEKLKVNSGNVVVDGGELHIAVAVNSASIAYDGVGTDLVIKNLYESADSNINFWTGGGPSFVIKGDGSFQTRGAGANYPLGDNVISGSIVFGKTLEDSYRTKLFTWDSADARIENNLGNNLLGGNTRGVILEGPHSGHVVMGVQSGGNEGFHILSGPVTSSVSASYNRVVASFHSDGDVGIGTSTKVSGYQLVVQGSISGSAGLNVAGNTVITGSITSNANLIVNGNSTLSGSVTLNSIPTASSATNYDFLVQQSNQVVRQVNAAPIPVGGIIMWSGTIATIPSGWALCNGSAGTPDLRDKFVVGAHSDLSGTAKSNVEGSYNQSGGDISHNHGGNTTAHTLTAGQIPSHTHTYKDSYYIEINNPGIGASGTLGGADYVGPTKYKGSGDSDNDNKYVYWRSGTTNSTGTGGGHSHPVPTDNHVPPYFALAYIMYTG